MAVVQIGEPICRRRNQLRPAREPQHRTNLKQIEDDHDFLRHPDKFDPNAASCGLADRFGAVQAPSCKDLWGIPPDYVCVVSRVPQLFAPNHVGAQ